MIPRVARATTVEASRLREAAGTVGMSRLVLRRLYAPNQIDLLLDDARL